MLAFTINQWIILFFVLVLGWFLGLMSRSGAGRWKRAYEQERAERRAYEKNNEARIKAANLRIAELERHTPSITTGTAGAIGAAARGDREDLTAIRGIDRDMELRLNDAGLYGYRDLARLSVSDEASLEGHLGLEPGRISRERWGEQAEMLRKGHIDEHRSIFA